MKPRHFTAALIFILLLAGGACAETIGLRFVVNKDVAREPARQQSVRTALGKWVETLNSYYRNSEVELRAEIAGVTFAAIGAQDAAQILDDMAGERNGFSGLFSYADELGADYTVAVTSNLSNRGKRSC